MTDERRDLAEFVTHTFHGARFTGVIPVEVLPELAAYREVLLDVARALFFHRNPERKRVSSGFEQDLQLVLKREIGQGSGVAYLQRLAPVPNDGDGPQLFLMATQPHRDLFDDARDALDEIIETTAFPAWLPPDVALRFNALGRTLHDDEKIVIKSSGRPMGVTYDRERRKRLVLLKQLTYEDAVDVVGEVVQFDRQKMTFDLLVDGQRAGGRLDDLDERSMQIIFTAGAVGGALRVRVAGVGARDDGDRLQRLVRIAHVQYAEDEELKKELDVERRLAELAELQPGWLDGDGVVLEKAGLKWATLVLQRAEQAGLPRPFLYPTPEGHLQAEWSFHGAEVSAEIDLDGHTVELLGTHTKTRAVSELRINLDAGVDRFVSFVTGFTP